MNINEISKPITSKSLNESLAKRFGQKINVEKFTLEQLYDARNQLRTRLSQVETNESFQQVHSETYQKSKMFLDVINTAISERENIEEKAVSQAQQKLMGMALAYKRGEMPDASDEVKELADSMTEKELEDFAGTSHEGLPEKKTETVVRESAQDEAEIVMAAKGMVDRVTTWLEDTAEMQTETMLELGDAIRDEMGNEKAESFITTVKPSLEAMYAAMEETRSVISSGVGILTGEESGMQPMGADAGAEMDMGAEPEAEVAPAETGEDEFAASAPAAGGTEPEGRAKRESIERVHRIASILSSKKK